RSVADKALYEATISTFALPNALRIAANADVIVCVVPTLLAAAYATILKRIFRKRLVLWVQDLVLSAAESVGVEGRAADAIAAAHRLERATMRAADTIVVCSSGFRDYFIKAGVDPARLETILNWADTDSIAPRPVCNN